VGRIADLNPPTGDDGELRDDKDTLLAKTCTGFFHRRQPRDVKNDEQFKTDLTKWTDLSALNTSRLRRWNQFTGSQLQRPRWSVVIPLANPVEPRGFFLAGGGYERPPWREVLPIIYDDNYVDVFPHEQRRIVANFQKDALAVSSGLRLEGYNVKEPNSSRWPPRNEDR